MTKLPHNTQDIPEDVSERQFQEKLQKRKQKLAHIDWKLQTAKHALQKLKNFLAR